MFSAFNQSFGLLPDTDDEVHGDSKLHRVQASIFVHIRQLPHLAQNHCQTHIIE